MIHVNFGYAFWHIMVTISKMVKLTMKLFPFVPLVFFHSSCAHKSVSYIKIWQINIILSQNGHKMAIFGHKMAIVKLHQSTTCGYSKPVPGDA